MSRSQHRSPPGAGRFRAALAVLALIGAGMVGIALLDQPDPSPLALAAAAGPPAPPSARADAELPSPPPDRPAVLHASAPVLLSIPAIKVSSPVTQVGQAVDGTIAVPLPGPTYDQAAWYRYSPAPGSRGPAVIVGHVDSKAHGPSVFFQLDRLRAGNTIDVTRADGSIARFVVRDVQRYPKAEFPTAAVYGNTAGAELRLITCGGPFDRSAGHYEDNVVVTADLQPSS